MSSWLVALVDCAVVVVVKLRTGRRGVAEGNVILEGYTSAYYNVQQQRGPIRATTAIELSATQRKASKTYYYS